MKIDVREITPYQKLIIAKGLCDYRFIMDYWQTDSNDFQEVFYDFYLSARWAVMSKEGNKRPFFEKLQTISPDDSLIDILNDLKANMDNHTYELSIGSKLLHTRNPLSPIYDSKVREYLINEEGLQFWWHKSGAPRGTDELTKIKHDWNILNEWYNSFMPSDRAKQWITWFDDNFPAYKDISDIKKIDFIIFATN